MMSQHQLHLDLQHWHKAAIHHNIILIVMLTSVQPHQLLVKVHLHRAIAIAISFFD